MKSAGRRPAHVAFWRAQVLVHRAGEIAQAREIGFRVGGVDDLVLAVQEVRDVLVGAALLADHVGAEVAADVAELALVAVPDAPLLL